MKPSKGSSVRTAASTDGQRAAEAPRVEEADGRRAHDSDWPYAASPLVAIIVLIAVVLYLLLHRDKSVCYPDIREETCYHGNEGAYRLYGTKTDYQVLVKMYQLDKQREYILPGCTARGLFLFNRHTTRYPDREDIVKMEEAMPRLRRAILDSANNSRVHLCKKDIQALSNWTMKLKPDDDNHVTESGREISAAQAKRFLTRFPQLFDKFNASDYVVGFTSRVRTRQTAEAFLKSLLARQEYLEVEKNFLDPQDDILQFHKECNKLMKKKEGTPPAVEAYEKGPYMKRLLDRLTWRMGINVTQGDLKMLLRACMFEYSIYDQSPWCSVFTEDDLKAVEFKEDLDDYYKDGYGLERNYAQACPVIQELVDRLELMANDSSHPNKVLYFSHAGGFKKVVARLGLNRDANPLKADGLCTQANRQWRSSLLCPFNGNVAFVLYNCTGDQHKVVTFLNEQPVILPGCPGHHCPLATFMDNYKKYATSCNMTQICSV
ncbi:multiple inositol polyphosphate phosphatase 1 isoform X1 [Dermacentor silvarum]|uniref:multiple inositol polyphosphate phosphatase 1 isoform X1 n=1 Tax=Dermacentor silvarum TaxID=543639 RepID=UPI00189952BD|nr:multiple inositol polyphosphate phosphatase 1 isoform X1 [Dermacentor silvarum]